MQFYSSENPELITKIIIFFKLLRFTYQLYLKIKYKGIKILTFCAVFLPPLALALQLPALACVQVAKATPFCTTIFPAARMAFIYTHDIVFRTLADKVCKYNTWQRMHGLAFK